MIHLSSQACAKTSDAARRPAGGGCVGRGGACEGWMSLCGIAYLLHGYEVGDKCCRVVVVGGDDDFTCDGEDDDERREVDWRGKVDVSHVADERRNED